MLKIEVRNSQPRDRDEVLAFMRAHQPPYHSLRPQDRVVEQIEARKFFLMVEHQNRETRLIGVSGLFPFGGTPLGAEAPWRELGGTRIILNGFGLHRLAIAARAVHETVMSPGADVLFSVLHERDVDATANHIASGFVPWTPPPALASAWAAQCTEESADTTPLQRLEGYQFLCLPMSAIAQLAYFLLRWDTPDAMLIRPASRARGAAEAANLQLSLDCLRSHRDQVELISQVELMTGRFGNGPAIRSRAAGY